VRIVSLFSFGVSGLDFPVPTLPTWKVLVVSAAQPHIVQDLLQDMRRKEFFLVHKQKKKIFWNRSTGEERVFPRIIFKENDTPHTLIHSIINNTFSQYSYILSRYIIITTSLNIFFHVIFTIHTHHINNNTIHHNAIVAYNHTTTPRISIYIRSTAKYQHRQSHSPGGTYGANKFYTTIHYRQTA
jgi:hypothetical protein